MTYRAILQVSALVLFCAGCNPLVHERVVLLKEGRMLMLTNGTSTALLVFKEFGEWQEPSRYSWRLVTHDGESELRGSGVVYERLGPSALQEGSTQVDTGIGDIRIGSFTLTWSWASTNSAHIYYFPREMGCRVLPADDFSTYVLPIPLGASRANGLAPENLKGQENLKVE